MKPKSGTQLWINVYLSKIDGVCYVTKLTKINYCSLLYNLLLVAKRG